MSSLTRRAGVVTALIASALALTLLVAPAAWANGPVLTDSTHPTASQALVGDQLSLVPGTYTGDSGAPSDTWWDCPSAPSATPTTIGCTDIQGSGTTYQVAPADQTRYASSYIVVFESDATLPTGTLVASNAIQAQPPTVPPPPPPPPPAPTNVTSPSILGTPTDNSTLIALTGIWQGDTSTSYTWWRCDSAVANCLKVATGGTYSLSKADLGALIRLTQTATDKTGSGSSSSSANSTPFGPITTPAGKVPAPVASSKPTITGVPQLDATLSAATVSMSGNPSTTYQWLRCRAQCTAIPGATTTTYTPVAADLGDGLQFSQTGTNAGGPTRASSTQTAQVTAPTETTLQLTPRRIVAGQPVTLIATVTSATAAASPDGTITFEKSGTPVQSCNSVPTQPSGAGATVTCRTRFASTPSRLSAVFSPAANSLVTGSDSASGGFVVGRAPTTAKLKVPAHLTLGHRTTFVVKVHPAPGTKGIAPTGTVAFVDHGKPIKGCTATLSGTTARCTVTYHVLGTHAIAADYLGDSTFSGSSSRTHKTTVTVAKPTGYVSALMGWTFRYSPTSTQVATLRLTELVPGVSVTLACSGHGCPLRHHVYRLTRRACGRRQSCRPLDLAKRLHHAQLGGGAKLTVRLTHRDWVGKYYRFVMRPGHKPRIVTSCLAVGVTQPDVACTPR